MVNHIKTKPSITCTMHVTEDGKYVITQTIITDKRPVKYYVNDLLELNKKTTKKKKKTKKK